MALIEINWRPDRGQLQWFGRVGAAAATALGGWIFLGHSVFGAALPEGAARLTACALWAAAGAMLVLSMAWPRGLRPAYLALTLIALPIGYVLSHVLVGVVFYGVVTPVGLVFRLIGRDALQRRFDSAARTYWVRRPLVRDPGRYFRQF